MEVPAIINHVAVDVLDSDEEVEDLRLAAVVDRQNMRAEEDGEYDPMNDID